MESERNTLEKLSAVSDVKMSSQKQQEIWNTIEKEIDQMKPVRTKHRRSNLWGTGAAAVAAVAIVAGGFYAFSNHGLMQSNKPGVSTASHDTKPNPTVKFPTASAIQSISILAGPTLDTWTTRDPKSASAQVLKWLNSSTPYTGSIPKSTNKMIPQANIGPAQLKIKTSNEDITVYPVYYLVQTNTHAVQTRYVQDVVEYQTGNETVYLKSPQLFNWLKNNQWETEFIPPNFHPTPSYIDPQGHNLTMTAQMVGLTKVYVPSGTQETGNLVDVGGNASSKTLSITFSHLNINESTQPLTGGGIVNKKNTVTLANGTTAQWLTVTGHANTIWVLELQMGSVYISLSSLDNALSKNQVQQIASSMVSIQP